jgi:hypothetical protein
MNTTQREQDTPESLALGGLMIVVFGTGAVLAAIGLGWVAAALLGAALVFLGWHVRATSSPMVLTILLVGLGIVSLVGAGFDLLT